MAKYFTSSGLKTVDITGAHTGLTRTLHSDKGFFEVNDRMTAKALEQSGFVQASLMGTTRSEKGYTCGGCGFGSWFKKCSRCGMVN